MKKLTKIFLIILTSLTFGVGIDNAKATVSVTIKKEVPGIDGNNLYCGYGSTLSRHELNMYSINGNIAYCQDPYQNYQITSNVKEETITEEAMSSAYYAGVYAILTNGPITVSQGKGNYANVIETYFALRSFTIGLMGDGWQSGPFVEGNHAREFASYINFAIDTATTDMTLAKKTYELMTRDDAVFSYKGYAEKVKSCQSFSNLSEARDCLRQINFGMYGSGPNNTNTLSNGTAPYMYNYPFYASGEYPPTTQSFDKKYYTYDDSKETTLNHINNNAANINDARDLLKKGIEAAYSYMKGEYNEGLVADVSLVSTNNPDKDTEIKTFVFNIKNITDETKVDNVQVVCEKCNKYGIKFTTEYQENGEWKELTSSTNLAKYVDNDGKVQVRVTFDKSSVEMDDENCENVTMKLRYNIYPIADSNFEIKRYRAQQDDNSRPTYQRFWAVSERYVTPNGNNKNTQTKDSIEFALSIPCGAPCETNLTTPICSEDENGIAKVEAPENVKKCVINNKDDATNEYRLADTNGGVNNDYCGTFCKEDYREIALNKALNDVNCGGYFKLKARIEGSKDCYRGSENTSDKAIDIKKYTDDIIEIQKSYIAARDVLLKTEAAGDNSDIKSKCTEYGDLKDEEGNQLETEENCTEHTWTLSGNYSGIGVASANSTTGSVTSKTQSGSYTYTSTESAEDIATQISDEASEAKDKLTKLDDKYDNTLKQFNACTNEWQSKYNFDPKVRWEYSQNFDNELDTSYNDLLSKEDRTLVPIEETRKDTESLVACTGTTDDKIENCSTGWTSVESVFVERTYLKCNADGCSNDNQKVSQAKFVKQHFTVEQDYDTPTVYYQTVSSGPSSGAITTYKDFQNPNIPLSPVKGLPLSGDTTGGGVFKLRIEDLGEFYETGEQGRLIDFDGDYETHSVAYAKGYEAEGNWSGEYVCHYYTDCRPKDCPDCNFVCVGDYCYWEECPTCNFDCINCIYNLGNLQLNMKPVSTSKFNESAGREYGYNWNINVNLAKYPELAMVQDKAEETIKEIEENNTTIYDDTNRESDDSKLEFSIEMTPEIIENIRQYNKEKDGAGGYNDASLVCYDYEDQNGILQENVFCYSTFIDEMITKYGSNVYYKPSRGTAVDRSNESVVNSGYWTPWSEYGNYGESVIGGPSWK